MAKAVKSAVSFPPDASRSVERKSADVVVCNDSGFGNDALVNGIPVVVLNVLNRLLQNGRTLIERGRCPAATTVPEFVAVLERLIARDAFRLQLIADARRYAEYFCRYYDQDAARRVADKVISCAFGHLPLPLADPASSAQVARSA